MSRCNDVSRPGKDVTTAGHRCTGPDAATHRLLRHGVVGGQELPGRLAELEKPAPYLVRALPCHTDIDALIGHGGRGPVVVVRLLPDLQGNDRLPDLRASCSIEGVEIA